MTQLRLRLTQHALFTVCVMSSVWLFSGCSSVPEKPALIPPHQSASPAVSYALSLQGAPYSYGHASPEEGFDCSGFVKHVYETQGISLPRTARDMALVLPEIPLNNINSGDVVFFNSNGAPYSHVGIYINNDQFIHAPSQRSGKVIVSSLNNDYWKKHYMGIRRPRRLH